MQFTQNLMITGARAFNDTVEGQKHDFTKVRVSMPVPDNKPHEVGFAEVEMPFGKSDNFEKFKPLAGRFPLELQCTVTATSKGFEIVDVKVPGPAAASAKS